MRGNSTHIFYTDTLTEATGPPIGENEKNIEDLIITSTPLEISEDNSNALSRYH